MQVNINILVLCRSLGLLLTIVEEPRVVRGLPGHTTFITSASPLNGPVHLGLPLF